MPLPGQLTTVAVVGNGLIGHGVAQVFAMAGRRVRLIGRSEASLGQAMERIRASLKQFQAHGLISEAELEAAEGCVLTSGRLEDAAGAELVIEAVTEDLALKRELFGRLDALCPPPVVLASSSGQPASALVEQVKRRRRVIAAHFWYPPQLIPLVEVCAGPETARDVVRFTTDALAAAGKQPVVLDREVPGFIGNRLQFAMLREAWALWASGAASAEAIDRVVKTSFGRRLAVNGPIESADLGGLDTMRHVAASLLPSLDAGETPPAAVSRLVEQGARGLPNGRGVYDWNMRDGEKLLQARAEELFRWLEADRRS